MLVLVKQPTTALYSPLTGGRYPISTKGQKILQDIEKGDDAVKVYLYISQLTHEYRELHLTDVEYAVFQQRVRRTERDRNIFVGFLCILMIAPWIVGVCSSI